MRLRWDLAWLRPPPPLATLRRDAVSLSYAFWPISDQAAIMPRHLAQVVVFVLGVCCLLAGCLCCIFGSVQKRKKKKKEKKQCLSFLAGGKGYTVCVFC